MIHAFAYLVFILIFTPWLGHELNRKYVLKTHWLWILGAVLVGLIGAALANIFSDKFGNFLLHASGGASSTLLFIYLFKTLKLNFNWPLNSVLLFGFVSSLGVMNELAEYAFELLNLGILSFDTHDAWRDFVANTSGAFLVWLIYGATRKLTTAKASGWF